MVIATAASRIGRRRKVKAGTTLLSRGDIARNIFLVVSGEIISRSTSSSGRGLINDIYSEGSLVGLPWLVTKRCQYVECVAENDTELLSVNIDAFNRLIAEDAKLSRALLDLALSRLMQRTEQLADAVLLDARCRLAKSLLRGASIESSRSGQQWRQPLNFVGISQRILGLTSSGMARESVNRELKKLQQQGLIQRTTRGVKIIDMVELQKIADGF